MSEVKDIAIVADGEFPSGEYAGRRLSEAEKVICCDGAVVKYLAWSEDTAPDAIVGDMDTLSPELKEKFAQIIVKYDEQDYDDLAKAVRYATSAYPKLERVSILGAGGGAEDFTIGNYGLLMEFAQMYPGVRFEAVSDHTVAFSLTDSSSFPCTKGRTVSVFSPDPTLRLVSEGLEWPLDDVCFDNWWKGIRNRVTSETVTLRFSHPSKVLIILA